MTRVKIRLNKNINSLIKQLRLDREQIIENELQKIFRIIEEKDAMETFIRIDEHLRRKIKQYGWSVSQVVNIILATKIANILSEDTKIEEMIEQYLHPRFFAKRIGIGEEIILQKYRGLVLFGGKKNHEVYVDAFEFKLICGITTKDKYTAQILSMETNIDLRRMERFMFIYRKNIRNVEERFSYLFEKLYIRDLIENILLLNKETIGEMLDRYSVFDAVLLSKYSCPEKIRSLILRYIPIERIAEFCEWIKSKTLAEEGMIIDAIIKTYRKIVETSNPYGGIVIVDEKFIAETISYLHENYNTYAPPREIIRIITTKSIWDHNGYTEYEARSIDTDSGKVITIKIE